MSADDCANKVNNTLELSLKPSDVRALAKEVDAFIQDKGGPGNVTRGDIKKHLTVAETDAATAKSIKVRNAALNKLRVSDMDSRVDAVVNSGRTGQKFVLGTKKVGYVEAHQSDLVGMEAVNSNNAITAGQGRFAQYTGKLADIELVDPGADTMKRFSSGEMDTGVYRAMQDLHTGERGKYDVMPTDAERSVAKILHDTFSAIRQDLNNNGAFIGKVDMAWVGKQVHDPDRIRPKLGETRDQALARWKQDIMESLDFEKTHGITRQEYETVASAREQVDNYWNELYSDIVSGHFGTPAESGRGSGTGSRNQAKQVSHERKIHFRDIDAFAAYQKKYGVPTLYDATLRHVRSASRSYGILSRLGPNYEANVLKSVNNSIEKLKRAGDEAEAERLREWRDKKLPDLLAEVDGSAEVPHHRWAAKFAAWVRKVMTWSKLGGTSVTMVGDTPNMMGEAHMQGADGFASAGRWLKDAANLFGDTRPQRVAAQAAGVVMDVEAPSRLDSFENPLDNIGRGMTWVDNAFRRASLFTGITERTRQQLSLFYSSYVGGSKDVEFDKLDPFLREIMEVAGFDEHDWNLLRTVVDDLPFKGMDGKETVHRVMDLDGLGRKTDEELDAYLKAKGIISDGMKTRKVRRPNPKDFHPKYAEWSKMDRDQWRKGARDGTVFSKEAIAWLKAEEEWRSLKDRGIDTVEEWVEGKGTPLLRRRAIDDVANKWIAYVNDSVMSAQIEAKPEVKHFMRGGQQAGTPGHIALSLISQFKTYSIAWAKQRAGRGATVRRNVLAKLTPEQQRDLTIAQRSPMFAVASLITGLTISGYMVMSFKSMMNNETPQDPTGDKKWEVWLASFLQGGGAGMYGEFLFARTNRYGGSVITQMLGPSIGAVDSMQRLVSAAVWGDKTATQQLEAAVRLVHSHLPGQNLFYAKAILDFLIFDRMYNAIREGSVDERFERRLEERGTSKVFGD